MLTRLLRLRGVGLSHALLICGLSSPAVAACPDGPDGDGDGICDAQDNCPDFVTLDQAESDFSEVSGLTLSGNAFQSGSVARLTTDGSDFQRGAVFREAVPFDGDTSFSAHYRLRIHGGNGTNDGADGMAFVIHNADTGAGSLGGAGDQLGYGGIGSSVAVVYDTFTGGGVNEVRVAHSGDANTNLGSANPNPVDLNGGNVFYNWVDYDAGTTTLRVYISTLNAKPDAPLLTINRDLSADLGSQAYFGFTAATGGLRQFHDVERWSLTVRSADQTDGDGYGDLCVHPSADIHPTAQLEPGVSLGEDSEIGEDVVLGRNFNGGGGFSASASAGFGASASAGFGASAGFHSRVGSNSSLGDHTAIGTRSVVGDDTHVGDHAQVGTRAVIGDNVQIADGTPGNGVIIGPSAVLEDGAQIGAGVVIEDGARVGAGAEIAAGAVVEANSIVGPGAQIEAGVVVNSRARLGADVLLTTGAEVGAQAVIGDRVQIFADAFIDANVEVGDDTTVGADARLLSDVGDQCVIGERVVVRGRASVGSGTTLSDDVVVGSFTTVGPDSALGAGTVTSSRVTIGARASIGENVVLNYRSALGDDVTLDDEVQVDDEVVVGNATNVGGRSRFYPLVSVGADCVVGADNLFRQRAQIRLGVQTDDYVVIHADSDIGENVTIRNSGAPAVSRNIGTYEGGGATLGDNVDIDRDVAPGEIINP